MSPIRKKIINGKLIEEFYWEGRVVCYVDNKKYYSSFEEAIDEFANNTSDKGE